MAKRQPRLGVVVTEEMYQALEEESKQNFNAPISALVRQAIEDWLRARGHNVKADLTWGGNRREDVDDNPEGQLVGITAGLAA